MNRALAISFLSIITICILAPMAMAADGTADNAFTVQAYIALGAGLGMAIAAFGGALGQGKAAAAALEGIARNPGASDKLFTPMILGLALIESLVIYALVVAFVLMGNINLG